jgi:hypothetical protein
MFILDAITPRETKETGVGQIKNIDSENPWTFKDNNYVNTFFYFCNICLISIYIILMIACFITISFARCSVGV